MPDKAKELDARLMADLKSVNAQLPQPNPNYDASNPTETKRSGGNRKAQQ
jgi:hypothetical protein